MVIFLSGDDTFRIHERLHQLRDAFVKKYDPSGVNVVMLDGAGLTFGDFQRAVASGGFLSSRRFIALDRPFEADAKTQEEIAGFIGDEKIPDDAIVVFVGSRVEKKRGRKQGGESPLARTLAKSKHRESYEPLEPSEVAQWITKRVSARAGAIERAAVERLASIVGSDLWRASNEIEKLLHARRGKAITVQDVDADLTGAVEADIFGFTDALSRKDARGALYELSRHFENGANELYLLTMIARQIRILLSIADVVKDEPNPATIARRLDLHPFVVKKGLSQIRTFSYSELVRAHDEITAVDFRLKNSRDNPKALLELFVLQLCQDRR